MPDASSPDQVGFHEKVKLQRTELAQQVTSWLKGITGNSRTITQIREDFLTSQGVSNQRMADLGRFTPDGMDRSFFGALRILDDYGTVISLGLFSIDSTD